MKRKFLLLIFSSLAFIFLGLWAVLLNKDIGGYVLIGLPFASFLLTKIYRLLKQKHS